MSTLSTELAVALSMVNPPAFAAKLAEVVEREMREANERGYQTGWADAKNEALIAIEKLSAPKE